MQCVLINLDSQPERRHRVETAFAQHRLDGWTLQRLPAVDTRQVEQQNIQGSISPAEKGCYLSHMVALNHSMQTAGHLMIIEDDVLFNQSSFTAIETALGMASQFEWDILFTDVCVPHIPSMVELYAQRQELIRRGQCQLIPLDKILFAGSTAYIVNAQSKGRLLQSLTECQSLDLPYDIALRRLVYAKRLKGFVAFPFPTSLSDLANESQIQHDQNSKVADVAWNAFRRLVWLGGSPSTAMRELNHIEENYFDPECMVFSKILGCMLSVNFVAK